MPSANPKGKAKTKAKQAVKEKEKVVDEYEDYWEKKKREAEEKAERIHGLIENLTEVTPADGRVSEAVLDSLPLAPPFQLSLKLVRGIIRVLQELTREKDCYGIE